MSLPRLLPLLSLAAWLLAYAPAVLGQVVRYRDPDNSKLRTQREVDSLVQLMNQRAKGAGYVFQVRIKQTHTRPDTIIHDYVLNGSKTPAVEQARQQNLQALIGKPLPAFALADLAGKQVSSASLRGKPVVLNLWFTSCGPCIAEMPWLNQIRRQQARTNIVFLAVTFESAEKVQAFLRKQPFTFRQLVGAKAYCAQFATGYPTSLFVDKQGIIRQVLGPIPTKYDPRTKKPVGADYTAFNAAFTQIQ